MKKIFSFLAAMCIAFAASAAVINITPNGSLDLRHAIRDNASAGDTVVLADGEYTQGGDYTYFDKNITVMAAENAHPIVKFTVPAQIKGGARAEIKGIKFDMTNLHGQSWYEHLVYATDDTDGNCLIFDGCEFYNDTLNNSVLFCGSNYKLDSLIVKNCIFHDILKSCIFIENTSATKGVIVENSTFYRITTNSASYWAGIIDVRSSIAKIRVDHCTFYDCIPMNTDYGCIGKATTEDAIVSNCIFALPTSTDGVRCIRMDHGNANNCLMFNYLYDGGYGVRSAVTKSNCIKEQDPLFANAAGGDFHLGAGSPALGAGTEGSNLGDPRWWPAPVEPVYRNIYCKIESSWWKYNAQGQPTNSVGAYAWGQGVPELAAWPGVKMEAVEGETDIWSINLDTRYTNIVFTRVAPSGNYEGIKTPDLTVPADSNAMFTITAPTHDWTSGSEMLADTDGYWSVFVPTVPVEPRLADGYYLIGNINGDSLATWTIADLDSTRMFSANTATAGEYMLTTTLAVGDQLQVVQVTNDAIGDWFPGGENKNYVVDANHAGEKIIFFRPDRQGGNDWWEKCIFIGANPSAIDKVNADAKAVKMIINGRLYIIRDGIRFNALGQQE